ncbi:probable E3 ubiquitin-protein ligase RHG1A isoform X1 [Cucumis sativus]|uniref:probable E3 ubiquitin-protein ligase RHG1A isoform X1 n=1 Tax=Cucumis sativus TaxID=3659 RepID=UPI0002B45FCA|nr:probable E3 ubiquitin-protein ligase RHG1A isoform X1 [Cucumis sativus]
MDDYPSKRVADGYTSRRGPSLILRDTANNRDQEGKYCSRIGCSGRLNSPKSTRGSYSEKHKSPLQSFRTSSSGKETAGSSSKTYYAVRGSKKSVVETQRKLSTQETDSSETSSTQDDPEISQVIPSNEGIRTGLRVGLKSSNSTDDTMMEPGSSSVAPNTRGRRDFNQRSGTRNKDTPATSSVLTASKSTRPTARGGAGRQTLRNFRCNSISDVISSGCSSSDPNSSKRKDMAKKRNPEAESSSTKGKKMNGSSLERRITSSGYGVSISDSRGAKKGTSNRENGITSGRSRTLNNGTSRARSHGNRPDRNGTSLHESRSMISQVSQDHQPDSSTDNITHEVSTELIPDHPISYRRSDSMNENILIHRPASPADIGLARSLTTRDSFRHYGIAEVLLALERIEHEEELTYEQVILLETNLFLSGLNFYDQHRDMRLDIDNMSYEELLALEERMGTVSTAVTEEALSQCLNRSTYQSRQAEGEDTSAAGSEYEDGVKCCICQEEYLNGDEVGTLQCEHTYHEGCIHQWLRLKNWCPICKASVEEPASALPS